MKAVLVGCGGISKAWMESVKTRTDVEMAGFVDIREDAAKKAAAAYGAPSAASGTDLDRILDSVKPDVVFDCTLPETHRDVTIAALKHGCHVLGEKPMAESMASARRMIEAANAANRTYAVMQNRRHLPSIRRLREFLDSGVIGRITTVHSDFFIGAHFGGFRDAMEHVLLLDMAVHTFDQARFIGHANPVSVSAHEWNPHGSWYRHGASAVAFFEMTEGLVYTYRGSWCSEGLNTPWEAEWRIVGEKGTVRWNGKDEILCEVVEGNDGFTRKTRKVDPPQTEWRSRTGHAGALDHMFDCIQKGTRPETVCTDNILSLAMVHGAIESASTRRQVTFTL